MLLTQGCLRIPGIGRYWCCLLGVRKYLFLDTLWFYQMVDILIALPTSSIPTSEPDELAVNGYRTMLFVPIAVKLLSKWS